jgi:hypothetical protein
MPIWGNLKEPRFTEDTLTLVQVKMGFYQFDKQVDDHRRRKGQTAEKMFQELHVDAGLKVPDTLAKNGSKHGPGKEPTFRFPSHFFVLEREGQLTRFLPED